MVTQSQFARHVGITQQAVSELVQRGIIVTDGRKGIDLDASRLAYCGHLRNVAAGRALGADGDLDLTAERARKAKEEADQLEMKNAQTRGELLARDDVNAAVMGAFARVRARLLGIPSKAAPVVATMETPAECEATIRGAIYEVLRELSETSVSSLSSDSPTSS